MLAVMLDGYLYAAGNGIVQTRVGRIVSRQRSVPLSLAVEHARQRLGLRVHTVVDAYLVAVQHHLVTSRSGVTAVVVVVLVRRDAESIFALCKHRLAEQIFVLAGGILVHQILGACHAVEYGQVGALVAEVAFLHAINHLRERDADIAVVDMAEGVVAEHHLAVAEERVGRQAVGQVDGLHGSVLVRQR